MVHIVNIKIAGDILEFDFIPEASKRSGHAIYDMKAKKFIRQDVVESNSNPGYVYGNVYCTYALRRVLDAIEEKEDLSKSLECAWY